MLGLKTIIINYFRIFLNPFFHFPDYYVESQRWEAVAELRSSRDLLSHSAPGRKLKKILRRKQ
jgi:hypothetical protein